MCGDSRTLCSMRRSVFPPLFFGVACLASGCLFTVGGRSSRTPDPVTQPSPSGYYAQRPCPAARLDPAVLGPYPYAPEALVALKYALARDDLWPAREGTVRAEVRQGILGILEDPSLTFEFSPPLVPVAHLQGGTVVAAQTIDAWHIRLSAFAGRDPYQLAHTMLHELVHVYQLRFQNKPPQSYLEPFWELPAYRLEGALPFGPFAEVQRDLACRGGGPPPPPSSGPCRQRRVPPSPPGYGEWVVWATPHGWLRLGT